MVIIRFKGGLGNQLFQYGLYRQMEACGREVKADITDYSEGRDSRKFVLEELGLSLSYASTKEIIQFRGKFNNIFQLMARKYGLKKTYFRENENVINTDIFLMDNIYLDGYWQNEVYFEQIKNVVLSELNLLLGDKLQNSEMLKKIESEESVSVHVRRGDYINKNSMYFDLSQSSYYIDAVEYIKQNVKNPEFYLFSDDIEWAKKYFHNEHFHVIEEGPNKNDYEDLILMSRCKHNIIANSSFSWWAAELNNNINKFVIAPLRWFNEEGKNSPACHSWKKI